MKESNLLLRSPSLQVQNIRTITRMNWNPHSLLQISPTPTLVPSTQLALVLLPFYVYPPSSEERDSRKDGFKLALFNKEAGINRVTGELLPPDWLGTKSCLYLIHPLDFVGCTHGNTPSPLDAAPENNLSTCAGPPIF